MATRIGVIGPGLMWHKNHKSALEKLSSRVQVSAICARSQSTLDAAGVPSAKRYTEIEELLADTSIDAVMVLTPLNLNAPTAIAALKAGKHVFLEKPMATSVEQCRDLLAAESAGRKRIYVLEQAAYSPSLAVMKKLLAERRLGDLVVYNRIEHGFIDADKNDAGGYGKTAWRQQADFPLGALFDGGIHSIAELTQLFGAPDRVSASGAKWRQGFGEFDEILMQFTYASGLRGVFSHASALPWIQCGFTVFGTQGVLHPADNRVELTNLDAKTQALPVSEIGHPGMWEQILASYEKGLPPPYASADAAQDVAILDAVAKAIRSKKEESVSRIV